MANHSYPFKNLVFQGGGVKGAAYLGALDELEKAGILGQIEKVAGTSAGAITALAVSFGGTFAEIRAISGTLEFVKIPGVTTVKVPWYLKPFKSIIESIVGDISESHLLLHRFGLHNTEYFYQWLQKTIAEQCKKKCPDQDFGPLATFAQFRECGFRDLHVYATNTSTHEATLFSYKTTPDAPVADAVRMSMSIPLYFESLRFDGKQLGKGDVYVDGGLVYNYPIYTFDKGSPNPETLGCRLFTPDDCKTHTPSTDIVSFAGNLFDTVLLADAIQFAQHPSIQKRSVSISDCCVSAIDFTIKEKQPAKYEELVQSGRDATLKYLSEYAKPGAAN